MSISIFSEKSKLINIGIVVSLLPVCALMAFLLWQFSRETSTAAKVFDFVIFIIVLSSIVLLLLLNLNLNVNQECIVIKYFPLKTMTIKRSDIVLCEINKINSMTEFGGWGMKNSRVYGKGYTTKGDLILTIKKKNEELISVSVFDKKRLTDVLLNNGYSLKRSKHEES